MNPIETSLPYYQILCLFSLGNGTTNQTWNESNRTRRRKRQNGCPQIEGCVSITELFREILCNPWPNQELFSHWYSTTLCITHQQQVWSTQSRFQFQCSKQIESTKYEISPIQIQQYIVMRNKSMHTHTLTAGGLRHSWCIITFVVVCVSSLCLFYLVLCYFTHSPCHLYHIIHCIHFKYFHFYFHC